MKNALATTVALFTTGVLLFIAPMVTLTERSDNVTQEKVKLVVEEFVTDVQNTGKLTRAKYLNFESELASTGNNTYEVDMEIRYLDKSKKRKTAQTNSFIIGENGNDGYYSEFKTQTLKKLGIKADNEEISNEEEFVKSDTIILNEGDIIIVEVKNTNSTAAQTLKSSFIGFANANEYVISARSSGMVTVNGRE